MSRGFREPLPKSVGVMLVTVDGVPFDPCEAPPFDPNLPQLRSSGGMGIHLIRSAAMSATGSRC